MKEYEAIIREMESLARKCHEGQFRKKPDGRPYIVHPEAVYNMLLEWGYCAKDDVVSLCVAWGHDILEEARPESRGTIEREIAEAGGKWGDKVLAGIKQLSLILPRGLSREEHDTRKAAYIENIADNAPPEILVVKMADRLCNTRDFAKGNKVKAREYLNKGMCLFKRVAQMPRPDRILKTLTAIRDSLGLSLFKEN